MKYMDIDYKEIAQVKTLWEKNGLFHQKMSQHFSETYRNLTFEERMSSFKDKNSNALKITISKKGFDVIGYCISSIQEGTGEICSIFVEESYRGKGIGEVLVKSHLDWMKNQKCKNIGVNVSQENTTTIGFYRKMGFYPNTLYMQQLLD